ncbi:MAG: hypothetical protein WCP97_06170 [bacterium]
MDVSAAQSLFIASIVLFAFTLILLLAIIAPILFQVFLILKRFNSLLQKFEQASEATIKKAEEALSFVVNQQFAKAVIRFFSARRKQSKQQSQGE